MECDRSRKVSKVFMVRCTFIFTFISIHLWKITPRNPQADALKHNIPITTFTTSDSTWMHHQLLSDLIFTWLVAGPERFTVWLLTEHTQNEQPAQIQSKRQLQSNEQLSALKVIHMFFFLRNSVHFSFYFPLTVLSSGGLRFPGK